MKIVVQNFKTGALSVADAPSPRVGAGSVLVRTRASLISAGTDRAVIGLAKKSYLGKALDRPDLARKVINRARTEGLWSTYSVVKNLIAEPIPLGYSLVGIVEEVGAGVGGMAVGDRVACAGLGYANHAERVAVPKNLVAPVPAGVSDEAASYVTLGAIAMHGIRQANQQLGATVLVVGLGLLGQITAQLCCAAGYKVIGIDLDPKKIALAGGRAGTLAVRADDPSLAPLVGEHTRGHGVDAALLTLGARDSGAVFEQVAQLCRDRARVVVVGDVKMDISRRTYFEKELEIVQSRSYGPGRYDPNYEQKGQDYPIGYVRWTEQRNMQSVLDLQADKRIDLAALTTHRFPIGRATEAYDLVTGKCAEFTIGIVLEYPEREHPQGVAKPAVLPPPRAVAGGRIGLGVIGTGQFAKGILLPSLIGTGGFEMVGVASARGISATSVQERYKAAYATTDSDRLLDDAAINAVVIATRHDSHASLVIRALKHDKHVFVEKPLAMTDSDLAAIEEAAAASSGRLMVGFNRRFSPMSRAVIAHFEGRVEPLAMLYRVNAGRIPVKGETAWVHDPQSGGGRIIGEACHFIDLMQAVCGARPIGVQAMSANPRRADLASDDIVSFTVAFDDGSIGTVHYWSNGDASVAKERMEVYGQGRIAVLDNYRSVELFADGKRRRHWSTNSQKGFAEQAEQFLALCRDGRQAVDLQSYLDTTRVTLAVMASLAGVTDSGDPPIAEVAE